ncbi:hypothetical protein AKJ45_02095 [candidate division MSBL1 archaeon SCGC-AAA261F19]|uniref:siroheme decarboxylase n=1 Tax=candidate division MSBL1 archaeon SCGC-AAA261F19 TaxID=1698275 RepID=A0A133VA09_9EURY|nr:hypothetical protein AKJ45_02095 [candidate division MSBL1 archaeon SCGC-AAA261F19]
MEEIDLKILRRIQSNFPIVGRPFRRLSDELDIGEDELIRRIRTLEDGGYIRSIKPKLNSSEIGYEASTLVGVRIEDDRVEEVAGIINGYENVSLNYERDADYNLWFTLHAESWNELRSIIEEMKDRTDPIDFISLPKEKQFKLKVVLDPMLKGGN